jgi:transcription termination/antitermination protein NusG
MQPDDSNKQCWYALQVKSRHEFKVFERLMGAGVNVFLPSIERISKWKDRNKLIRFPLFPSYLFVNIDNTHAVRTLILKTNGVVKFLGVIPGDPEPVPEDQILALKKVLETKETLDLYPYLHEGQRVRIMRGPLAGVEGILAEKSGRHMLVLSVDIIRQSTSVAIQASDVERI